MPTRRCPHCRLTTSFETSHAANFNPTLNTTIRFEICRNEACRCCVAVVIDGEGREVDIYPKLETEPDEELPEDVKRAFREAMQSLNEGIWNGCVTMCRRALDEAVTELGAGGDSLYHKIEGLAQGHKITPELRDWAHEGRLAGNLGAHGAEQKKWADKLDAEEIMEFCKWFFRYVYVLPAQLNERKARVTEPQL